MKKPFLFFLLFLSVQLSAQTLIASMEDTIPMQEIREVSVYSSKKPVEVALLSLPVVSIHKSELETPSFFTPADALQRKASISLTRDGIWATSVNIRGLSKEQILILADGERIQAATDISAALSAIDMNSLEQIEVIKGAGAVLYGTGAMGGVVNFITERPSYTDSFEVHGRAGTGFNTVNNLWTSHAKVQISENNWYLAATGSYRNANNTETPGGTLENSQFKDWSFGVRGGMTYGDSQELLVNYQNYGAANVGLSGGNAFRPDAKVRYRNVARNLLSGEYIIYEPVSSLNEIRIKAYTQNISRDVENYLESDNLTILPSSTNATSGAKIITDWDLFSPHHHLIVGAEGWLRKAETKRYKIKERGERDYFVTGEQPIPDAKMIDFGAFAQYSWKIHPNKLTLDAGLRLDYIRIKNDSAFDPVFQYTEINGERENIDIQPKLLFAAGETDEFSYSAHLDFVYRPRQQHAFALSVSNAYRAASLEERFKYIDQGSVLRVGNPKLKPEQGGFSNFSYHFSGNKFKLKTDIFANYLFNLITEIPQLYTKPDGSVVNALVNNNIDNALFLGAELEVDYWITDNFHALANAGYTRGRDVENNEFLPQIPPLKGLVELNYHYRNAFTATLSTNWAARQSEVANGEKTTDGYIILNAALRSGKINFRPVYLQFFVGMDNILNTAYYNHLRTTRVGYAQEEPGRNIYAKVQIGW